MVVHPGFDWGKRRAPLDTRIQTLSDYPLLIGEILRRHQLRSLRRAQRKAFIQKVGLARQGQCHSQPLSSLESNRIRHRIPSGLRTRVRMVCRLPFKLLLRVPLM
jgi:hypothetical protein